MELTAPSLIAEFDRRVSQGIITFDTNYRTIRHSDNGFQTEFRLLSGLNRKPGVTTPIPTPSATTQQTNGTSLGLRSGSDINVHGYEITSLSPTHLLAFNKFSSARPHLLVLTQDGFRRQYEVLDDDDLHALWRTMNVFEKEKGRYIAIFNCGVESGCSRLHKHMQVFKAGSEEQGQNGRGEGRQEEGFKLWPDTQGKEEGKGIPFRYFLTRFEEFPGPEELARVYRELVEQVRKVLGWDYEESEGKAPPHNVVLDRKWLLVVPRRAAGLNGAEANAAAALGMVWVSGEEKMRVWMEQGVARVMAHLGVAARE